MNDTIFALSSGAPPAAIAVVRISGPNAGAALALLAGSLPSPRQASYRVLRVPRGTVLDHALVLWFPGPSTATGEDLAEMHLHGGRAVVAAVEAALLALPELRRAQPGEFTRRAFANGRIDLAEAEGLADLLAAETEVQRVNAVVMASGVFSRQVGVWRARVLEISASVEAALDFADDDDLDVLPPHLGTDIAGLTHELADWLARPRAEPLLEGFRVVLAGPPNAGKSTLFNALVDDEAAIVSPIAGTTRDVLTRAVALDGIPFVFADTAGLREASEDVVEAMGIDRARLQLERADCVLWLGAEGEGPHGAWEISAQVDRVGVTAKTAARHRVSALTGEGVATLRVDLREAARQCLPLPGDAALNARQHLLLKEAEDGLCRAMQEHDLLLIAEGLRQARASFDSLIGRTTTEDMLDALFGRFCIGK